MATVAPGTTAPVSSTTLPTSDPYNACAPRFTAAAAASATAITHGRMLLMQVMAVLLCPCRTLWIRVLYGEGANRLTVYAPCQSLCETVFYVMNRPAN